jgi:hypothetical protein
MEVSIQLRLLPRLTLDWPPGCAFCASLTHTLSAERDHLSLAVKTPRS